MWLRLGTIRAALLVAEAQRIARVFGEIAAMAQQGAMAAGEASIEALLQDLGNKGLRKAPQPRYAIEGGTSKSRRTFYRPTNWGGVGWGVIAFVTTARHDGRLRYAFVTTARHDGRLRYAFVSTARHDVMLRYAFVTTAARHDLMLRYAFCHYCKTWWEATLRMGWGRVGCGGVGWGVGCDSIRHYCKTWCDATLRIRLYCKTWCDATLRIRLYCKTWWEATLRYWKLMINSRQHSFPSPRQTQWFVVQIHSKSPMEMGTHWLRLADRHWRSCKISHAVKRKGHFDRSPGFEAQNPVRVANHTKTDVFFHGCFPHEIELAPQRNKNF